MHPSRGRRSTGPVTAGGLALLLGLGGCATPWASSTVAGSAAPARTAGATGSAVLPAGVDELLHRRADAVLRADPAGWLGTVDPSDPRFVAHQRQAFASLRQLPISRWSYRAGTPGADRVTADALALHVLLSYRLQPDRRDTTRDLLLELTRSGSGWRVAGERSGVPQPSDLWQLGPLDVVRGERSLVIGAAGRRGELSRYATELDTAARRVDAVWGPDWPRPLVALVPQDLAGMAALLGPGQDSGLDQLAAVTTGQVDPERSAASGATAPPGLPQPGADRVVVNAAAFDRFGPVARAVVLTHEVTHLATRGVGRVTPPVWLQEGFADYVAYRDSGLDRATIGVDLLDQVSRGGLPAALPAQDDFRPGQAAIRSAYAGSWLAVDLIARLRPAAGSGTAVRFYRAAAQDGVESAFRTVLGLDQAAFVQKWRTEIAALCTTRAGAP